MLKAKYRLNMDVNVSVCVCVRKKTISIYFLCVKKNCIMFFFFLMYLCGPTKENNTHHMHNTGCEVGSESWPTKQG